MSRHDSGYTGGESAQVVRDTESPLCSTLPHPRNESSVVGEESEWGNLPPGTWETDGQDT